MIKTSAPPEETSSISISSIWGYLNLFDKLFLDWKGIALPDDAADDVEPIVGLKPFGAQAWAVTGVCTIIKF